MTRRFTASSPAALLACALTGSLAACSAVRHDATVASVNPEVREFMIGYAAELSSGNREAVAARYARTGAHLLRGGSHAFRSFDEIRDRYLTTWRPPLGFEWCGLEVETVSPDAAVVVGLFNWRTAEGTRQFSYSALLTREDGEFRIRVEDEASKPEAASPDACESAFAHP